MAAGKERWWWVRRDSSGQGETAVARRDGGRARRDGSRQGETVAGKERQWWARRDSSGKVVFP